MSFLCCTLFSLLFVLYLFPFYVFLMYINIRPMLYFIHSINKEKHFFFSHFTDSKTSGKVVEVQPLDAKDFGFFLSV